MEEESKMVLRTEDLVKKYGKRTVVSHVSINVKQGEIVGLLGPNGAGKTTSFYMTVGLITPNEGRIFLDDLDITKYPVYKRAQTGIGYLAQEASVFRQMSVEDNIAAVLEMTDKPLDYQKDKLESLIAEFRLQKVRKNKGNQLSGGERRRTEIARCLAIDPKFIMLDEPFAGVDPIAVEDILYRNGVYSRKRFIQHNEFRVDGQATGNLRTTALSTGQLVTFILTNLLQTKLRNQALQLIFLVIQRLVRHFQYGGDIILHTHLTEHGCFLRQITDTCLRALVHRIFRNIQIIQKDTSFIRSYQSYGHIE